MPAQVGVTKAFELASEHPIPIVRVHHMEAHAMVTRLPSSSKDGPPPDFPYATGMVYSPFALPYACETVLVSGGHNMVLLTTGLGAHTILGR